MKIKIYFSGLLTFILISFIACKKQNIPVKPIPTTVFSAVLQDNPPAFASAKTITFINITAGNNGWYLTQVPGNTWCVPDKSYGAGDYSLRVTLNANTTGADRTTQIILTSTNSNLKPVTLNVLQSK